MSHQQIEPPLTRAGGASGSLRRRVLALGAFGTAVSALIIVVVASLNTGSGGTSLPRASQAVRTGKNATPGVRSAAPAAAPTLGVARAGALPSAVSGASGVAGGDGALIIGGLDRGGAAVGTIYRIAGGQVNSAGTLANALHGAAATALGTDAYLFGGGRTSADSAIVRISPGGRSTTAGQLPQPVFDASAATVGDTAYVIGGFTGKVSVTSIVSFKPGNGTQVVANLPTPLRFAAVGAVAGHVVIAGGTVRGVPSRAVYSFDPASATVTRIGWLPSPLTRAGGAVLNGKLYVIGGRGTGRASQSQAIYAVDPTSGVVTRAALMPVALADVATASLADRIIVAGGTGRGGEAQQGVFSITPR